MDRKKKNVVLDCEKEFGPEWDWMPKKLVDLGPWVEKYLELVPEEYRDSAAFKVVSLRDSQKDYWLNVKVHYFRPETDDEMAQRLEEEEAEKAAQEREKRQMLEDLKAKFNDR